MYVLLLVKPLKTLNALRADEEEAEEMARAESTILENLNWKGNGLISAAAGS